MNRAGVACLSLAGVVIVACVAPLPGTLDRGAGATGGQSTVVVGGGGGGGGGVAGASGSSGGAPAACGVACTPAPGCRDPGATGVLISGFESMCSRLDGVDGRDGGWFEYADRTTIMPDLNPPFQVSCLGAAGSCYSVCASGRFSGPTAGLGVVLRAGATRYDVTRYRGVSFDYLSVSESEFLIPLASDTPVGVGDGTCTANCLDSYRITLAPLTGWQHREVLFSDLRQRGSGAPTPWDPTGVIAFQWSAGPVLCVDNVELLPQ